MNQKGVTIQEVLIVGLIAVVVVGIDIGVFFYTNMKVNDIRILSEVNQIRSALEVTIVNNNYYPESTGVSELNDADEQTEKLCVEGFRRIDTVCTKELLKPIPNGGYADGNRYYYQQVNGGTNYFLEFTLQSNFKRIGLLKGQSCATSTGIENRPCFSQ